MNWDKWTEPKKDPKDWCDIKHEYVRGVDFGYCDRCGASVFNHCPTGEHTVRNCPGDHGK